MRAYNKNRKQKHTTKLKIKKYLYENIFWGLEDRVKRYSYNTIKRSETYILDNYGKNPYNMTMCYYTIKYNKCKEI